MNGSNLRNKKRVNYLSCIEWKGGGGEGGKDIHRSAQNAALFVDLSIITMVEYTYDKLSID